MGACLPFNFGFAPTLIKDFRPLLWRRGRRSKLALRVCLSLISVGVCKISYFLLELKKGLINQGRGKGKNNHTQNHQRNQNNPDEFKNCFWFNHKLDSRY